MVDVGWSQRCCFAVAACALLLGATSCASSDSEPVATGPVAEVGDHAADSERLPAITLAPTETEPMVVRTAIGVLEFTEYEFPAGHQFLMTVSTPHGLVAPDVVEGSLRWSIDDGITWEGITVAVDPWRITTVDGDVVVYGHDGAARYGWDGSGWAEAARLNLTGPIGQLVFGPGGAVAVDGTTVYWSADGTHFTEADQSPHKELLGTTGSGGCDDGPQGTGPDDRLGSILATDAGYVALTPGYPDDWNDIPTCQPRLWFSPDGNTWELTADTSSFGHAAHVDDTWGLTEYDGRFAVSGRIDGDRGAVWLSDDGLTWQLADVDPHHAAVVAAGELGWILTGGVGPDSQQMWFSRDGMTWDGPYALPSGLRSGYLLTQLTVGPDSIFGIGGRDVVPVLATRSTPAE